MIRVDRHTQKPPAILSSANAERARAEVEEFFLGKDAGALQSTPRFQPRLYGHPTVREALSRLFHDKCAFCESYIAATMRPEIHFFRPKYGALDLDGKVSREHYHWLVYDWDNLYPVCISCNRAAGAKFPVQGRRAPIGAVGEVLGRERPLLLDPCLDDPDADLAFDDEGPVAPRSEKGAATIDVFALNRPDLVRARATAITGALADVRRVPAREFVMPPDSAAYAGALRQVLARTIGSSQFSSGRYESTSASDWPGPRETKAAVKRMVRAEEKRMTVPVQVESIELRNFRAIEELDLDFAAVADTAPWTMLLGENGAGKTSILQALALALAGEEQRGRAIEDAGALVRHGARSGQVRVHVRGALKPIELRLNRGRKRFRALGEGDPAVLAAYGAGRVPGRRAADDPPPTGAPRPRIENLFEPTMPLVRPEPWLAGLDRKLFHAAALALKRVLDTGDDAVLARRSGGVVLKSSEGTQKLADLSDGYRSMIALATDLMSVMVRRYDSLEAAEGIVLIDEIGAHLHPTWQMRIVEAMRAAFPHVQFITTTHDPLCLRGVKNGEVVVLHKPKGRPVFARTDLPPVEGLRVDQLLTSEHFGLKSTIDPTLEKLFDAYYALLAKRRPTKRDERRIEKLRDQLADHRLLGFTRRERLALEAADEFLAQEADEPEAGVREDLEVRAREKMRAIWAEVGL